MKYAYRGTTLAGLLFFLASVSGFTGPQPAATAEPEKAPSPQLVISLERQTIRENDQLPIRVFLANPSDQKLENVRLGWSNLPVNVALNPQKCADVQSGNKGTSELAVGELPAQQDPQSVKTLDLCLVSTTVTNGDYTLLFNLQYDWTAKGGSRHSLVTMEKPIKSAFLGTDSLAGVPLALMGFIVPGLLFWLALDFWKTPWRIQGPTLGDKTVYSVLVSLLLVALVSVFPGLKARLDITKGLSLKILEYLALLGGAAGMLVGGFDRWLRELRTRRALQTTDDDLTLLTKLLRLNFGRSKPKTTVQLSDGQVFQGSVGAQNATETFLIGWYKISPDARQPGPTKAIHDAVKAGDFAHAVELAQRHGFPVNTQDFLYRKGADGAFAPTDPAVMRMQWANTLVVGKPTVEVGTNRDEPLTEK